jgi:tetratricopeptide (TPR) repeat protein
VEFTCLWFQKHLSRFLQSDKKLFLVTGQPGAGKTTIAGSIVERLQRPVNHKQVDTLFCSLSPDIPTTATSLAVVKSLLFQLLNIRVGNLGMYHALLHAYYQCRTSADLKTYEEHLWQALADTLRHPIEGGNDLIMVVDGLDEIAESQSASIQAAGVISPSALLEKLTKMTNEGQGVRLITLSSSLKLPPHLNGIQHQITREDVRDDLHAVALRALVHNKHFHGKPANEQESMIDSIIQAANGSFLWTILVCENLNSQKSSDAVTKTLTAMHSSKSSVQDLVLKLFTSLDTTNNAKTALSWIMAAERPLTVAEIHTLFTVDTGRSTLSDKGVDVNATVQTLKPFLTLHEHIVRFRHPIIHTALHDFAKHGKIPIHLQESETDLLLRVLTYAKCTLRDKGEPLIDNHDPTISDRLFCQHHFLEYTVRYWALHLQQSSLAPKPSGEFKPTADLQKALPDTTILPILEQLVWDSQLPIPEAIDLHKLVGTVRRTVFTDNHPSVLQTYLAVATCYHLISDTKEAQKYFYLCTKISRTVLSDIHPLTLDCASHYLKITQSMTTTTRTEVTTRREEILIILIAAYERQYGSTSELVIQTRKLLVELYASIHEEDRAMEVYRLIQDAIFQQYGRNSHQAHDVQGHLSVILGKGKIEAKLDQYKESFFHNDEEGEEESVEVFDIASIIAYLRRAELYISRKDLTLAEQTYVELWQEVSSKCRTSQSVEWHEKNIEVATSYTQFLKTHKRSTEASAILTCVWQQYEHHQLSYSESIVARLTHVAKEMKSIGSYTQALSIFKHASSFYKNVRQEETHISREVNKEVCSASPTIMILPFHHALFPSLIPRLP